MSGSQIAVGSSQQSLARAWYTVILCMVAYIFSFVDRQVITLLIEPIRADLGITDTQFSLVTGLAFALFYASMGIPIAWLADRKSRPMIISVGIFLWSIATALCGTAKSFGQLFLARMGVGVGEAALSPAAYSIITDSFPKSKLGRALGVYSIGSFIGSGLAFLIGGTVIEIVSQYDAVEFPLVGALKPWQMTFFIVGLPGVLIAALFFLTVRDPERKGIIAGATGFTIREVLAYIGKQKYTFIAHFLGFGLMALALFALLSWAPAYLIRNYELSTRDVGIYLGVLVLISNTTGVLTSGWLADRFTSRGITDAPMRSGMIGGLGVIIPAVLFPFMPGLMTSLLMLAVAMFFASFPLATSAAALQMMAPNQMRAQVTALFFLSMNILGITGGATLVALCTDYVFGDEKAVGWSMALISSASAILGAITLGWGLKHFRETVQHI